MSSEDRHSVPLQELYKQVILDHHSRPRNRGLLPDPDATVHLENPTCGDTIDLQIKVEEGRLREVRWQGRGCSISMASASMMSEALRGKTLEEARRLMERFRAMMRGETGPFRDLGEIQSLQGVARYPVRIKCATLAWNAVEMGMSGLDSEGRS